jgi:hypothetical protein
MMPTITSSTVTSHVSSVLERELSTGTASFGSTSEVLGISLNANRRSGMEHRIAALTPAREPPPTAVIMLPVRLSLAEKGKRQAAKPLTSGKLSWLH